MAKDDYRGNWRRYWPQQLSHALLPAAGVGLACWGVHAELWHLTPGFATPAFQFLRQALEWADQRDTIGIDLSYVLGGAFGGFAAAAVAVLVKELI